MGGLLIRYGLKLVKNPTLLIALVAVALGAHHWYVINDRSNLRIANANLQTSLETALLDKQIAEDAANRERRAAMESHTRRNEAERALSEVQRSRRSDPSSQEWANESIPPSEIARWCAAMPELNGCD